MKQKNNKIRKIDLNKTAPTKIFISAKCSDLCFTDIMDQNGDTIFEHNGYVPPINEDSGGDYITIEIDCETGKINNWNYKQFIEDVQSWIDIN